MEVETAQLVDKDASYIFQQYTIPQIHTIRSTIATSASSTNEKLSILVNNKYRDFLLINDKISVMNDISQSVHTQLSSLVFHPSQLSVAPVTTSRYNKTVLSYKIHSNVDKYLCIALNNISMEILTLSNVTAIAQEMHAISVSYDTSNSYTYKNLLCKINKFIVFELKNIRDYESDKKLINLLMSLVILNDISLQKVLVVYLSIRIEGISTINEFLNYNLITIYYTYLFQFEITNNLLQKSVWNFKYLENIKQIQFQVPTKNLDVVYINNEIYKFRSNLHNQIINEYEILISGKSIDEIIQFFLNWKKIEFISDELLNLTLIEIDKLIDLSIPDIENGDGGGVDKFNNWVDKIIINFTNIIQIGDKIGKILINNKISQLSQKLSIYIQDKPIHQLFQIKKNLIKFISILEIHIITSNFNLLNDFSKLIFSKISSLKLISQDLNTKIHNQYTSENVLQDSVIWEYEDIPLQPSILLIKNLYQLFNFYDLDQVEISQLRYMILVDLTRYYIKLLKLPCLSKQRYLITVMDYMFICKLCGVDVNNDIDVDDKLKKNLNHYYNCNKLFY